MHTQAEIEKNILFTKFVRIFLFAVFALIFAFFTIYFDSNASSGLSSVFDLNLQVSENEKNFSNAIVRKEGGVFEDIDLVETYFENNDYVLEFSDSRFWGNFFLTESDFNLKYENIVLIPKKARFDFFVENGVLNLNVFDGDVYMGILGSEIEYLEYRDEFSKVFLNTLIVPKNTSLKFKLSSVNPKYATLLPDKLQKQMDFYASIPSSIKNDDEWVYLNNSKDIALLEDVSQILKRDFSSNFGSYNSSFVIDFKDFFVDQLTLFPEKKALRKIDSLFSDLDAALYLYSSSQISEAEIYLDEFLRDVGDEGLFEDDEFNLEFQTYLYKLSLFSSRDDLSEAYLKFLTYTDLHISYFETLDYFWFKVYESIDYAPSIARNSLNAYYEEFKSLYALYSEEDKFKEYVLNLNFLFDNLLFRYTDFYTDNFFALKNDLEDRVLRIYEDSTLKQEVLQSMVSNKIEFLRRSFTYFKSGKITLEETQKIYDRLLSDVKDIMDLSFENDTAVISVFKKQLKTIEDFWGYLNATEYNTSAFYGQTHEERYQVYLKDRQIIPDIDVYFNIGESEELSLDGVKNEIMDIFSDYSLINVQFLDFENIDQRFISISAVLNGYSFVADYDRYNNTVKNVVAFEQDIVGEEPTSFKNLSALLESKLADLAGDEVTDDEVDEYLMTHAERVARNFVMEKIKNEGFVLEVENVKQLKDEVDVYRISDTYLEDYNDVILTFDYDMNGELLTDLYMIVDGKPLFLEEDYTLTEMKDLIYAEEDFSILETHLNDELNLDASDSEDFIEGENEVHDAASDLFGDELVNEEDVSDFEMLGAEEDLEDEIVDRELDTDEKIADQESDIEDSVVEEDSTTVRRR